MGQCLAKPEKDEDDGDHPVEFAGGNVHLIATKDSWDQKLEEARRDGKIIYQIAGTDGQDDTILLWIKKLGSHMFNEDFETLPSLVKINIIVIANFSATWCGPCRMIAPFYSELSEKHPSLMFLTVDVDELTDFSSSWDIKATPTFFFLRDGQQIEKLVGANKPELQKKITAILDSAAPCQ